MTSQGQIIFRGDDRVGLDPYQLVVIAGTAGGAPRIQFVLEDSGNHIGGVEASLPTHGFVHVTATLDDATGRMSLYLDGVLAASDLTNIRPFRDLDSAHNPCLGLGNAEITGGQGFPGVICDVRIYNRALSGDEVRALYLATGSNLQAPTAVVQR